MKIAGLERNLKKFPVSEGLDIAAFILFGDTEIIKGVSDYGFVTKKMSVKDLEKGVEALGGIVSRLRLFK